MLFIQGKVAEIRLMRAEMANKLQPEDLHTIRQHLDAINQCEAVKVLILRGEGKYFCSGYDISDIQNSQHEGSSFGEMVDAIEQCRPITVVFMVVPPTWHWPATFAWAPAARKCSCLRHVWGCISISKGWNAM